MKTYLTRFLEIKHWLPFYFCQTLGHMLWSRHRSCPQHIYFLIVDHFEPKWMGNSEEGLSVVKRWCKEWPQVAVRHRDSRGRHPQHNFFLPIEEYNVEVVKRLASLCENGYGSVEVHLHHGNDTPDNLRRVLLEGKHVLHDRHGLLRKDPATGEIQYGFIHGNWALDNSSGDARMCGVNNEIDILLETGCYADFTMPSGTGRTQTRTINSLYYAMDDPQRAKSHDVGIRMTLGMNPPSKGLLMIQGPLGLNWRRRKSGLFPTIEDGDVSWSNPPSEKRIDLWIRQRIRPVRDNKSIIVKIHTHGANRRNVSLLLEAYLEEIYSCLESKYNDGERYRLFYVSAYELYLILKDMERNGV